MKSTTWILDGFLGRPHRWEPLRRSVEREIGPCRIWRYDSTGRTPLEHLGASLREDLESTPGPANLIGYSMGGLVVREALRECPDSAARRVVTMNTPHQGTLVAHCLGLPALRQMRPGSEYLKELDQAHWPWPTLAMWCPGDLMVIPGTSARWSKADRNHRILMPAHIYPVYSKSLQREILAFLKAHPEVRKKF